MNTVDSLERTPTTVISAAIERVRASRDRGVSWLLNHIGSDGEPVGAQERNGWGRVPWALAVSGESSVGAAVVEWAERGQLAPDGGFAPGPALGEGRFPAYPLAHFAIGCWMLERFSTSLCAMSALRAMQDPATGGLPIAAPVERATDLCDLLSTAQTGLAAVITGQDDIADLALKWTVDLCAMQPQAAGQRFFTFRRGSGLLTEPPAGLEWAAITHFDRPRQTYYNPGMAAVFLAAYAQRRNEHEPIALARQLMQFNIDGVPEQFNDLESVQICKFGWGASALIVADPTGDWNDHVVKMGNWFIDHQAPDGSWKPSTFLTPQPSDIDRLVKTSEHVMEVNAILAALGTIHSRLSGTTAF